MGIEVCLYNRDMTDIDSVKKVHNLKARLTPILREMFGGEASGHDLYHLERVYNLALHIQEKEGGDVLVIGIVAFLHDVHRLMQNERKSFVHPKESLPKVQELLEKVDFPVGKIKEVLHCIEFHEEYSFSEKGRTVNDLETLILQDADNLDAIGAVGVGRTFSYGGAHGVTMWNPDIPLDLEGAFDESMGNDPSTIHHFYHKLFRLGESMNTATGKSMAASRVDFMQGFVDQFLREWRGEV